MTAPVAARNAALEAAVIEDPSDAALLVLGDWLQSQGDPRGALIALQHAQASEKDPTKFLALKRDAAAHYAAHEAALLGPLDPWRHLFQLDWHLGYIRGVRMSFEARRDGDPGSHELLRALVSLPSAVALQDVAIGSIGARDPAAGRYAGLLAELCATGEPRALRSLFLGDYWRGTTVADPHARLGDGRALGAKFPRLRKLVIASGRLDLRGAAFPELRVFHQRAVADGGAIAWLRETPPPRLEHLHLQIGTHTDDLRAALAAERLPMLRQLRLTGSTYTERLLELLAELPLLRQLELVDVDGGNLEDEAAARVMERLAPFRHLALFRLGQQRVTWAACKRLREAGVEVTTPKAYQD